MAILRKFVANRNPMKKTNMIGMAGLLASVSAVNPGMKLGLSKSMVDSIVDSAVRKGVEVCIFVFFCVFCVCAPNTTNEHMIIFTATRTSFTILI